MRWLLSILCAVLLAVPANSAPVASREAVHNFIMVRHGKMKADRYTRLIMRKAKKYDIPPSILASLIHLESNFNERATSRSRPPSVGLMQIKLFPKRIREMKGRPYDPEINVDWGCRYLKGLYYRFSRDWHRALVGYNMGPLYVVNRGYTRTRYSRIILQRAERLRSYDSAPERGR